jgi:hypothetical protein
MFIRRAEIFRKSEPLGKRRDGKSDWAKRRALSIEQLLGAAIGETKNAHPKERPIPAEQCSMLDAQCSMLDA